MIKIAPSILSADLLQLQQQVETVEQCGADYIHVDVMDGRYVPNITFGPVIVRELKRITSLPLDVHLMIKNPEEQINKFAEAGADIITVHPDSTIHIHRTLMHIREQGCKAGISLNPGTDISVVQPLYDMLDLLLIMTVNPGFPAQKLIPSTVEKIKAVAEEKKVQQYGYIIEVDGGINETTIPTVVEAGAEMLVLGDAIMGQENIAEAFALIRQTAERAERGNGNSQ
jgi:ribulose-phosphate 3-epimerase